VNPIQGARPAARSERGRRTITGGLASQLEPKSGPVTGANLTVSRGPVRENGPGGEPGVVAEDPPGPDAMHDRIALDRMPADDKPRREKESGRLGP
jgi:hypothetical protein